MRSSPDDADYYCVINQKQLYDRPKIQRNLTLGQLSDDWSELEKIHTNNAPPIAYALIWLAAIMCAVGQKVVR